MVFSMTLGFPKRAEQIEIAKLIETPYTKIDQTISQQQHQIETFREYKTILIHNAVTGKIKVC